MNRGAASRHLSAATVQELVALAKSGRFETMETRSRQLLRAHADSGFLWKALSVALEQQGKDAISALQAAARLLPQDPECHSNLGAALRRSGRVAEALTSFERALAINSNVAEVWNNLGNAQRDLGLLPNAVESFARALQLKSDFTKSHSTLGLVLQDLGRLDEAATCHRRVLELEPGNAEAHVALATVQRMQGDAAAAESNARRALELNPRLTAAATLLAELYADRGEFSAAEDALRQALAMEPDCPEAWAGLTGLRRMTRDDGDWLAEATRVVELPLPPRREAALRFALGKYFDDVGDYAQAFAQYARANELSSAARPPHDRNLVTRGVDALMESYDAKELERVRIGGNPSERPVFIVGMPRSGTTLAEQILSAHDEVFGAGELSFWNTAALTVAQRVGAEGEAAVLRNLAEEYLAKLETLSPATPRVVNKTPANFFFLGLIHATLPRARIIHMQRNPLDTCLSIYFQNFGAFHSYANDLEDIAHYYGEYLRIMEHWRRTLPPTVLLEVPYEGLVADPEIWSRRMVEFLGLGWKPACLEFQGSRRQVNTFSRWQARQKITRASIGRWRNYEGFIGGLRRFVEIAATPDTLDTSASLEDLFNRACVLHDSGNHAEAKALCFRILKEQPRHVEALNRLGVIIGQLGDLPLAAQVLRQATAVDPSHATAAYNCGIAFYNLRQFQAAVACFDRVIDGQPKFAPAYFSRGNALRDLGDFTAARASFERAVELNPGDVEALVNLANVLRDLGQFEAALPHYARALSLAPDCFEAHQSRAVVLMDLQRPSESIESVDRAIALKPDDADAHCTKAYGLLLRGDYERGWEEYEWRRRSANSPLAKDGRHFSQPLWLGDDSIAGRTVLLHSEQGLGDTLQFCRYVDSVAALGARIILEVPQPLVALLESVQGAWSVVARGDELPDFDYQCSLMSLPRALRTTLATVPNQVPYLSVDRERREHWAGVLGVPTKPRVGLAWSGGLRPHQPELAPVNGRRNIALAQCASLKQHAVEFYSLQKGEPAQSELDALAAARWDGPIILDYTADLQDFADTAALIDNLDLVICVDTAVAHLAGALAKPVWLLNRYDSCWRWMTGRNDSPWYPTLRIYRQPRPGDWAAVIEAVCRDLEQFCRSGGLA